MFFIPHLSYGQVTYPSEPNTNTNWPSQIKLVGSDNPVLDLSPYDPLWPENNLNPSWSGIGITADGLNKSF
jgi:hypothetical protein